MINLTSHIKMAFVDIVDSGLIAGLILSKVKHSVMQLQNKPLLYHMCTENEFTSVSA